MNTSFDLESLLKGLGKDLGAFAVKAVIPDDDPALFHCHIRTTNFEALYDVPEHDQGITVCYDAERKLLGLFMYVNTDIPNAAYAWALDHVNSMQSDDLLCFSQLSIAADDEDGEEEATLSLECSYHLSTKKHTATFDQHTKLMGRMIKDAMQRLFSEAHQLADEFESAFEEYVDMRPQ